MRIAIYPGSFDPVTKGHMDIIRRAATLFDELVIGVLNNSAKSPLFTPDERVTMLKMVTDDIPNIRIVPFSGLTIDFCHTMKAQAIVRGLRAVSDFEYELQLSQTNRVIAPDIDTVFLTTNLKYSYLSSSIVKEIASYDGDISAFVDGRISEMIHRKIRSIRERG